MTTIQKCALIKFFFVATQLVMKCFRSPFVWWWNFFDYRRLGDQKHSVTNCGAIDFFLVATQLVIEKIGYCKVGDWIFLVVARFMATEIGPISITHKFA
jgi:hypothetical protein